MYDKHSIIVNSSTGNYAVSFKEFNFQQILSKKDLVFVDRRFAHISGFTPSENTIEIESGEEAKDISGVARILSTLASKAANKETKLIVVGGGTIQDLATFVASTYMRGINWDFYPTTLQAMADSCIGGKSAINVGRYKNLIGNFYPPNNIYIDATLIRTLDPEDITCGLLEAIKICFAARNQETELVLDIILGSDISDKISDETFENVIEYSLKSKKYFIEQDEFDRGIRRKLNFGHTYGHAIEAASDFKVHHGLAVGVGILASFIHRERRLLSVSEEKLTLATRKLLQPYKSMLSQTIRSMDKNDFFRFLLLDKKITSTELRFIHSIDGQLEIVNLPNNLNTLESAFNAVEMAINDI